MKSVTIQNILVATAILAIINIGCTVGKPYDILLPNDFALVRAHKNSWAVVKADPNATDVLVGPNVTMYAVVNDYVVGYCEGETYEELKEYSDKVGYFLIKTKSGEIIKGLTKEDAEKRLVNEAKEKPPLVYTQLDY